MTITPSDALDLRIAQGPPVSNLGEQIANIPNAYWAGLDEAYKRRTQDAFKNGVPTTKVIGPDGKLADVPDWKAIGSTALQAGGIPSVGPYTGLAGLDIQQQQLAQDNANAVYRATGNQPSIPSNGPPANPAAPPLRPTSGPPGSANGNSPTSVNAAVSQQFSGEEAGGLMTRIARGLGVDPDQNLDPAKQAQVATAVQRAVDAKQQRAPVQAPPAVPGQLPFNDRFQGQNAPVSRPPTSAEPVNDPNSPIPPGVDPQKYLQGLRERARSGTKEGQASIEKEIKNVIEWQRARSAVELAGRTDEVKKNVDTLNKMVDEGLDAKGHSAQIEAIRQLGRNVPYGIIPKVQSILGRYGIETNGLNEIQAYERAIDFMAPQLRPVGSGRLLQTELGSFKSALGGLMTTPEGREISANNLQLLTNYKSKIGEIAADTSLTSGERINKIYALPAPHLQTELPKAATQTATSAPQKVTQEQYQSLPAGRQYIAPDGSVRTKK